MAEISNRQNPIDISNAIKAAIEHKLPDDEVKRGSIYFYLNDLSQLPLITIESGKDKATHKAGGKSIHHPAKLFHIRATTAIKDGEDPEEILEQKIRAIRLALFYGETDFSPISLEEVEGAEFSLPQPGTPIASLSFVVSASFHEPI
ncbi:MAG: hypothetical protein ACRDBQ_02430 [Shewanella sp.]